MSKGHRYVVLDVFTDTPLQGNQLAVFADASEIPPETMQPLARELNLSETVFVLAPEQGADARIRIFTPTAELPFAGHPVLGTAIAIGVERALAQVTLETGAGVVPVTLRGVGVGEDGRSASSAEPPAGARIAYGSMRQPIPTWQPFEREAELLAALGVERSGLPVEVVRERSAPRVRGARRRGGGGGARAGHARAGGAGTAGCELLRGRGRALEDAQLRACDWASRRTRRRAPRRGRWRYTWRATGGSRSGRRSRSARARRRGDRRCCAHGRSAPRTRSSSWR